MEGLGIIAMGAIGLCGWASSLMAQKQARQLRSLAAGHEALIEALERNLAACKVNLDLKDRLLELKDERIAALERTTKSLDLRWQA